MGTSGSSRGPGSGTPLVPTWLDEPTTNPVSGNDDVSQDQVDGDDTDGSNAGPDSKPEPRPPIQLPPEPSRFQSARTNFTRFARSGGSDTGALRRGIRDYVRSGTRGARSATQRMGSARTTASGALGVFRGLLRDGVETTLRRLDLNNLVGRSAEDLLVGLTDTICHDGGSIDEAIGRDAWLETVAELDQFGIDDLDSLTTAQVSAIFMAYVSHAIEARLFQDIGINGFHVSASVSETESFERQLRDYIRRSVRDSFSSDLSSLPNLRDKEINDIVDGTYTDAWSLLEAWGDME
ncbi:Qat anti-phage system associated protein QatB [Thioalkalivibrio denitrificans]|uniref:Qat anti-phage system associated protein QatB n=1 Tax=Thioalkalivibrio denitrificans TaxID=108003 RepID=UPI0031832BD6